MRDAHNAVAEDQKHRNDESRLTGQILSHDLSLHSVCGILLVS
jgi:hypothetical protein